MRHTLSLAIDCARMLADRTERAASDYDSVARQCRSLLEAHGLEIDAAASLAELTLPLANRAAVERLQRELSAAVADLRSLLPYHDAIDLLFDTAEDAADRALVDGVIPPICGEVAS